jgi:hypothetical protein
MIVLADECLAGRGAGTLRLLALATCIWHNWSLRTTGLHSHTGGDH